MHRFKSPGETELAHDVRCDMEHLPKYINGTEPIRLHPLARIVGVVMARLPLVNRWQTEQWRPVRAIEDSIHCGPQALLQEASGDEWLHGGFRIELFRDEAEGYYLNLSSSTPFVFVKWDIEEGLGVPRAVTLSYHEAARWMDGGAQVDGVAMPDTWAPWLARFVAEHYRPAEQKKRNRPPSFKGARRDEQ